MEIYGHIQNGVVVLDPGAILPEGTRVTVVPIPDAVPETRIVQKPGRLPSVQGGRPGTWNLTNEQIGAFLDDEDGEALKRSWNVPS